MSRSYRQLQAITRKSLSPILRVRASDKNRGSTPLAVLFLALLAWVLYVILGALVPEEILFLDDQAFSIALADRILNGEVLLAGIPSHLGGRHIGPFYPYYIALLRWLAGPHDIQTLVRLTATIKLCAVLPLIFILRRVIGDSHQFWLTAILTLALIVGGFGVQIIGIDWAPNLLLLTCALTLSTALLVITSGPSYLLPFLLAASISLQTHLSSAPLVLSLGIAILPSLIRCGNPRRWIMQLGDSRTQLIIQAGSLASLIVIWALPLRYELSFEPNIYQAFFGRAFEPHSKYGLSASLTALSALVGLAFPVPKQIYSGAVIVPLVFMAGLAIICLLSYPRFRSFILGNIGAIALLTVVVSRLAEEVHPYYLISILPSLYLLAALSFNALLTYSRTKIPSNLGYLFQAGATLLLVAPLMFRFFHSPKGSDQDPQSTLSHATSVAETISADLAPGSPIPKIFVLDSYGSLRADSIHLLLGPNALDRMATRRKIKELPKLLPPAESGYLLQCDQAPERALHKVLKLWQITAELPLNKCSTCSGCKLSKLVSRSRP